MAPIIKTFNCISTSTPIVPLKRPYYCCGWYEPPKWFSGKYIITKSGNPPYYCGVNDVCTPSEGVAMKLERESNCSFSYIWKSNPQYLVFAFYNFQLCAQPNGSDVLTTFGYNSVFNFEDPPGGGIEQFECSYNLITKQHYFSYKNTIDYNDGNGNTFYRYVELDTVKME